MKSDFGKTAPPAETMTPFLEGFYERVARRVGVDVSVVVGVALGTSGSLTIEDALRRELKSILSQIKEGQDAA